jgi:predicted ATPase
MPQASDVPSVFRAGRSPFVGRARQLAVLAEQLAEARAGHTTVVLLTGPGGIGKTRLLDELPRLEVAHGATVLRGGASQAEGMPPYLPFLEALGDYVGAAPADQLREQVGQRAAILATLLPEIPARLGPPSPLYPLGPEPPGRRESILPGGVAARVGRGRDACLAGRSLGVERPSS